MILKKRNICSLLGNILIIALVIFSITWNYFVAEQGNQYHSSGADIFRYFTTDSNLFLGVSSLLFLIFNIIALKNEQISFKIPLMIKYMSVICMSITMLVVITMLVPYEGFEAMYNGPSLFTHLINPVLGIITFIFVDSFEKVEAKSIFLGLIPPGVYGFIYILNIALNGVEGNDLYNFLRNGVPGLILVLIVIVIIYFIFAFLFYKLNLLVKEKTKSWK